MERNLLPRISVLASLGINPITRRRGSIFPVWQFFWHASAEARYYYALRRKYLMSGFFAGLYACYNHKGLYFNGTRNTFAREYSSSVGPLIGYQHAFGQRVRASWGFMTVFYAKEYVDYFNAQGHLVGRTVWPANYTFYTYLRIGFTL